MDSLIRKCYNRVESNKYLKCDVSLGDNCLQCGSNMYFDGNDVNYKCNNKRYIYIARYLPVHSSEIYNALEQLAMSFYCELKDKEKIVFASFGAGPGIDTYAFHRWLYKHCNDLSCKNITAFRIECCDEWTELAKEVMFSNSPRDFKRKYYRYIMDVTTEDVNLRERFDIATLSYIVSELDESGVDKLIENIKNNKSECSYIVINDRNECLVKEKMIKIMTAVADEDYGFYHYNDEHCGFSYPSDIYSKITPKVFRKSVYFVGKLK
ncbi:hypothetical protein AB4X16_12555 [Edwardsiella tarda]|uniref:hypothetical protein n=1 Tax=Edwardsiella tarda TaxID=636 RepID=UPI0034DD92EF